MAKEAIQVDCSRIIDIQGVPKVSTKGIIQLKKGGLQLVKQLETMEVKNQADVDTANVAMLKINRVIKYIEAARKEATRPFMDAKKEVDTQAKDVLNPIQEIFDAMKSKIAVWRKEEQEKIESENRRIAEENRKAEEAAQAELKRRQNISKAQGGTGENVKPVEAPVPIKKATALSMTDSTKVRKRWVGEVEDETLVPRQFLSVDQKKINEAIRAGVHEIAGVKIYQKEDLVY